MNTQPGVLEGSQDHWRRYPFWSAFETGLLFISYQADLSYYEAIKQSMVSEAGDGHDRLEDIYHAVEGGYYFVPPIGPGAAHIGGFLFA